MGAQQLPLAVGAGIEEEGVVHLARRMADREIERGEIVVVGLDIRPFGDGEAEIGEDRGDLVDDLADRMDAAGLERRRADRQRDVDALGFEPADELGFLEARAAIGERLADAVLEPVQRRAHDLALLRRHAAEALHQLGDAALLAERGDAFGFERRLVGGRGDRRGDLGFERGDLGHSCGSLPDGQAPGAASACRNISSVEIRRSAFATSHP